MGLGNPLTYLIHFNQRYCTPATTPAPPGTWPRGWPTTPPAAAPG